MGGLSISQRHMLARVSGEWTDMPPGIGCTNGTLASLEKRDLVELRVKPGTPITAWFAKWEWRLKSQEPSQ